MNVVTGAEMRSVEQSFATDWGFPLVALMERAGYQTALAVREFFHDDVAGKKIHIVCGGGNNGGDGFVAARHLDNWGAKVKVWMMKDPARLKGDAAVYARVLAQMGLERSLIEGDNPQIFRLALKTADLIVDALIGTGFKGSMSQSYARAITAINEAGRPIVSVDVPSGVDADTGRVKDVAVTADVTVTFGLPKVGHLLSAGRELAGRLVVADIGIPPSLFYIVQPPKIWVRAPWARAHLKARPTWGHKGTFGRVLVVGGSVGMAGAAALTAMGALRSGAGLVQCLVPESILPTIQQLVPEATALGLPEFQGQITSKAMDIVIDQLKPGDVVAVGPGLGQSKKLDELLITIVSELPAPLVIDADGLNGLARARETRAPVPRRDYPRIMTPHPKEAARLLDTPVSQITDDPMLAAQRVAEEWSAVCVLKGRTTLTKNPGGTLYFNGSGDVSLATGGSGDVLTGVIAGLVAQGYEPDVAAALGVYVHGRAGELVAHHVGRHGSTARDVAWYVSRAFLELERGTGLDENIPTDMA